MIREALENWLTPCPRPWRRMGYLREQIAIDARLRRNREAWAGHLRDSKAAILEAVSLCPRRRSALLVGAGLHHDLPLRELASSFERVYLLDLVHRSQNRRDAESFGLGVCCLEFDVSGSLAGFYASAGLLSDEEALERVESARPGLPSGVPEEPDLVVSANVCAQLMILPGEWLDRGRERRESFFEALERAAVRSHLAWLRERSGFAALITECARKRVDPHGRELSREAVVGLEGLRTPDRSWNWRLAPIPESSRRFHREHEVCAWLGEF